MKDLYSIGIDLGTSNCALTYYEEADTPAQQMRIEQLESPGRLIEPFTLPSALYLPREGEIETEDRRLSWTQADTDQPIVGSWALQHGSLNPERLVSSAKSWLCYGRVHRQEAVLPWGAPAGVPKVSPVQASTLFLNHLRDALSHQLETHELPAETEVTVTVPASFDEVARRLTQEAAGAAHLPQHRLLEEPLAAFYAWISRDESLWREQVAAGDLVLVCDIGGGTSDFSLIAVGDDDGYLSLERIAVGRHLLLGGDNMDLALAFSTKQQLEAEGQEIDHWQLRSLILNAREAKEALLGDTDLESFPVAVASRGASLFSSTVSTQISRAMVDQIILNGFFPECPIDAEPEVKAGLGIQEFGLPYEQDPAVTRHLAQFLRQAKSNLATDERLRSLVPQDLQNDEQPILRPTKVLFNGGIFHSARLRERLLNVLRSWSNHDVDELTGADYDLAVAQGAAYYGKIRRSGKGLRVRSGTARSYYLGIESGMMAIPGYRPPVKGLCIVPQGTEEGQHLSVQNREFALITGQPAEFQLYSSRLRAGDQLGDEIADANRELEPAARLTITLPHESADEQEQRVPVTLDADVEETGGMALYMKHVASDQRWKLEFDLRNYES
jgi:hypothetical protein